MIAENTINIFCAVFKSQRAACANATLAILRLLLQLNFHMFTPLYLGLCVPTTLSYERVRNQCNAVTGTDSGAVLSVCLTKTYSYSGTEAPWLCLFSHRAPITPHCRGKANTESFTPRDRLSPDGAATPQYLSVKFSLKHTLHVSAGIAVFEPSVVFQVARSRTGENESQNMF